MKSINAYGFYRFFVFEPILLLVLINLPVWSRDPFSAHQIVSWILLIASLFLAIHGFSLLKAMGKPQGAIVNTTVIVRTGAYRFIRHPLYTSLLLFGWGAFFKDLQLVGLALAAVMTAFGYATARVEEGENLRRFGEAYADYIKQTKMFVPFIL